MSSEQTDTLKQLGNALVQKQQFEQAATIYTKALELDSTSEASAAIFSNRSLCYFNTKKYNEALQDAEKAISLRPTWFRGYQRAAAACEKLNNKSGEGLKHLEKCFELDEASKTDSVFKKMKEDFEINIIKQKAPSMTQDELKQAGNNYIKNQQYQQAIDLYTLAIEKDAFCDEAVPILSNRSMAYFKIGKYKQAYEDGGCCCGIKPDWAKGFMRRGVAAEKLGEWQIALESYDEYLKLDPQDEAGVKSSRSAVAKVVADLQKAEQAKRLAREKAALDLENTTDPDKRVEKSYELLICAAGTFDIETMKIALKQPCNIRLDTPFFVNQPGKNVSPYHPTALKSARKTFITSPESEELLIVLAVLISPLGDKNKLHKVPLKRQVEYLDFLLDIAEDQDFSAPNIRMREFLQKICLADPVSSDRVSIRKDLVISVFNRIDTARKVFHGKNASNKEFASDVLFTMSCYNFDPRSEQIFSNTTPDVYSDVCTQDLYECISTALSSGADPNIKTLQNGSSASTLDSVLIHLRSLKVVELLLRYGADPNNFGVVEEKLFKRPGDSSYESKETRSSTLSLAFLSYRPDLIRALLRHGAKLPEEQLPYFVLKVLPPSKNPLVKLQCPSSLLANSLSLLGRPQLVPLVTEEYIQLWFESIANQNLSFLCPSVTGGIGTPLFVAIVNHFDVRLIDTIIKLKPELLRQVYFPFPDQRPLAAMSPLGSLINEARLHDRDVQYLCTVAKVLMDHGLDIKKDIAQCHFESDSSDKVDSSLTGMEYVDGMKPYVDGKSMKQMEMLKKFMLTKK